jgi:class 3 adenylate cyclase
MRSSIRTKMIIGFLAISLGSATLVGVVSYRAARSALIRNINDRLVAIRTAKAMHISTYMDLMRQQVNSYLNNPLAEQFSREFISAYGKLATASIDASQKDKIKSFYESAYYPEMSKHVLPQNRPTLDSLLPRTPAAEYVQYHFLAANPNTIDKFGDLVRIEDDHEYARVHERYHPTLNRLRELHGYLDIMVIDAQSGVVAYSAGKEIDLGSSYIDGPFANTAIGKAIRKIRDNPERGVVETVDFGSYLPHFGLPMAFYAGPVFAGDKLESIMVFEFPIDRIYDIVTTRQDWVESGLGKTGAIQLVGDDGYLRNDARRFRDDPEAYLKLLKANGYSDEDVEKVRRGDTTIMTVKIDSPFVRALQEGKSGTSYGRDYLGEETLASFSPLKIEGLEWNVLVELPEAEALAPIWALERELLIWTVINTIIATATASYVGGAFARPIGQLAQAAKAFANGFYEVRVHVRSDDEVQDLAETFNRMAVEIESKNRRFVEKVKQNEKLLENMMPSLVMARFRGGSSTGRSMGFESEVTLAFSEISGIDSLFSGRETDVAVALLEVLMSSIDEAAERLGVDRLYSSGASFLAACGLSEPYFDHTRRVMEFAREQRRIVSAFAKENDVPLRLTIGIHRGPVTSGAIGRHAFIHDLWGRTVAMATEIAEDEHRSLVRVSKEVRDRMSSNQEFRFHRDDASNPADDVWIAEFETSSLSGSG